MKIGDVLSFQDSLWRVLNHNPQYRTFTIANLSGERHEIADDLELEVLHNPSQWPYIVMAPKMRLGRVLEVRRAGKLLEPLQDWVPSGFYNIGGTLLFHPQLNLKPGEVLALTHERGTSRANVTRSFGSAKQRLRKKANPWRHTEPLTTHERLMTRDLLDDD